MVLTHPETSTLQPSPYPTFNPVFNSSSSTIPGRCSAGQWPDGLCSTAGTRRVYRWGGEEEGKLSHHITRQPRSYLDISVLPHCPFIPALRLCGTLGGCFGCQWFEGQPLGGRGWGRRGHGNSRVLLFFVLLTGEREKLKDELQYSEGSVDTWRQRS